MRPAAEALASSSAQLQAAPLQTKPSRPGSSEVSSNANVYGIGQRSVRGTRENPRQREGEHRRFRPLPEFRPTLRDRLLRPGPGGRIVQLPDARRADDRGLGLGDDRRSQRRCELPPRSQRGGIFGVPAEGGLEHDQREPRPPFLRGAALDGAPQLLRIGGPLFACRIEHVNANGPVGLHSVHEPSQRSPSRLEGLVFAPPEHHAQGRSDRRLKPGHDFGLPRVRPGDDVGSYGLAHQAIHGRLRRRATQEPRDGRRIRLGRCAGRLRERGGVFGDAQQSGERPEGRDVAQERVGVEVVEALRRELEAGAALAQGSERHARRNPSEHPVERLHVDTVNGAVVERPRRYARPSKWCDRQDRERVSIGLRLAFG